MFVFVVSGNIGSTSTSQNAFEVDNSFHANDTVSVVINPGVYIVGAGGAGARRTGSGSNWNSYPELAGSAGGPALAAKRSVSVTNNGVVGGGGGGGGGGGATNPATTTGYAGGGGGGAGLTPGASPHATAGTLTAGGAGSSSSDGGTGGSGGGLGVAGGTGTWGSWHPGAAGGAAGAALIGKGFVNAGSGVTGSVYGSQLP